MAYDAYDQAKADYVILGLIMWTWNFFSEILNPSRSTWVFNF